MSTDADIVVEFEHLVNGADPAPEAPKRGRPRGRQSREAYVAQDAPVGLTFTEFEADQLADELDDRADDVEAPNPGDKYLKKRAKFLRDTAKAVRAQHPALVKKYKDDNEN